MNSLLLLVLIIGLLTPLASSNCDNYEEDIGGWTYMNNNPTVGNTSITITNNGILKAVTNNGYGMFLNYTPVFPISILNAKTFSFAMRGTNRNKWQFSNPIVVLVDSFRNELTFKPYKTILSTNGVSWVNYNIVLDLQFVFAGTNFDPYNKISRIALYTDTFDFGYTIELDNVTFRGTDNFCQFMIKGCRILKFDNKDSWSHIQELDHGFTNITTQLGVVRIDTTTGWGLWNIFSLTSTTGGDKFTFDIRGNNTTPSGWQGNMPQVTFTDDLQYSATFTPRMQFVTRNGVTWNTVVVSLSSSNSNFSASISPNFNRYSIKNITFFLDTWEAGFTVWIRNAFFESSFSTCSV